MLLAGSHHVPKLNIESYGAFSLDTIRKGDKSRENENPGRRHGVESVPWQGRAGEAKHLGREMAGPGVLVETLLAGDRKGRRLLPGLGPKQGSPHLPPPRCPSLGPSTSNSASTWCLLSPEIKYHHLILAK